MEYGDCDLMISSTKLESDTYEWIPMKTVPLYAVVPHTHRFVQRREISLMELTSEPYIEVKHNCGLKATLETCFNRVGFTPATAYEAEDLMTAAGFVSACHTMTSLIVLLVSKKNLPVLFPCYLGQFISF